VMSDAHSVTLQSTRAPLMSDSVTSMSNQLTIFIIGKLWEMSTALAVSPSTLKTCKATNESQHNTIYAMCAVWVRKSTAHHALVLLISSTSALRTDAMMPPKSQQTRSLAVLELQVMQSEGQLYAYRSAPTGSK